MAKGRKRPASELQETSTGGGTDGSAATVGGITSAAGRSKENEIRFGKHLASSDKSVRDRTLTALREWLQQRSSGGVLTDLDLLKIWRGLWYCMFMCDKAPVQRELAENLVGLMNLFKDDRTEGVRFFKAFCITMQRDWERIDNLRIDKYYTLVRLFVREAVGFCRCRRPEQTSTPARNKKKRSRKSSDGAGDGSWTWDTDLLRSIADVMETEVITLHPAPIGLRLHLADVWVDEILVAGGEDIPTEALLILLAPWLRAAASPASNAVVFKRAFEGIFERLLACFPRERGGDASEHEGGVFKKAEPAKIQACLFEVAAAPQTAGKRRAQLYMLHRGYQKLTGKAPDITAPPSGILPPPPESSDSDSDADVGGDGMEYVQERKRAVRGPEPPVAGWAAAAIASGDITANPGASGTGGAVSAKKGKRRQSSMSDDEASIETGRKADGERDKSIRAKESKKKKQDVDADSGKTNEESESVSSKGIDEPNGYSDGKDLDINAGVPELQAAGKVEVSSVGAAAEPEKTRSTTVGDVAKQQKEATPGTRSKKRKKSIDEARDSSKNEGKNGFDGVEDVGSVKGTAVPKAAVDNTVTSPPSSGKRKRKKKRRSFEDGGSAGEAGDGDGIVAKSNSTPVESSETSASALSHPARIDTLSSPPKSNKKTSKHASLEDTATTGAEADGGSSKRSQKYTSGKKKKSSSPDKGAPKPSAGNGSSPSFQTPPKTSSAGRQAKKSVGSSESSKKTVTFGSNSAKDHRKSVKDLKTRVITPSKQSGTPEKGLLKVGGLSETKPRKSAAGRKGTPHQRGRRAADFF